MGQFLNSLWVTPCPDGIRWELLQGFNYQTDAGIMITVPEGFKTDFASVPEVFQNIVPRWGLYGWGAVIHDWLYANQGNIFGHIYTRQQCDDVLKECMIAMGTPTITVDTIYDAVRMFGQAAWDLDAKKVGK